MKKFLNKVSNAYFAGTVGALANAALITVIVILKLTKTFDLALFPDLSWAWLLPRMVWGGILALLLLLPFLGKNWVVRGLILSLIPTVMSIYAVPYIQSGVTGALNFEITIMVLVVTYLFNCIWGLVASYLYCELS